MIIIGVDVGLHGAAVAIDEKYQVIEWMDTPLIGKKFYNITAVRNFLEVFAINRDEPLIYVWIEAASVRPAQSAQSGLSTGLGYGIWQGLCAGLGLRYTAVRPQEWMRIMLKGMPKSEGKARATLQASRMFPSGLPLTGPRGGKKDGRADAALIAAYGLRKIRGENG
jgi:hypothetical protein